MICTAAALICKSIGDVFGNDFIGFPSFWPPEPRLSRSAGTEFLREIATLRDEARVRGDPEKLMGQGSLDPLNTHSIWSVPKLSTSFGKTH